MDKEQALHSFWSSFGLPAYDENTVPDDAKMPYITYSVAVGAMDDVQLLSGSLWYRSSSWKEISKKCEEIAKFISDHRPYTIKIDGGYAWISYGSQFARRMGDPSDDLIRRIYLNLDVEFLTNY